MKITKERVQNVVENATDVIRFNEDDEPNKYGETDKMSAIMWLVENEKDFEDADFETNDDDWVYYLWYKSMYDDMVKARGGKKPVIVHYFND